MNGPKATSSPAKAGAKRWRVLLVDPHPVVRRGLREILSDERQIDIVAEASSVDEAAARAAAERPDLVIVDVTLGPESGLKLIARLRAESPKIRALVFSARDEALYAERALRAGADGYVGKRAEAGRILDAVRRVLGGHTALSGAMTERLIQRAVGASDEDARGIKSLSDRELEVLRLIGRGLTTRGVAEELEISVKTVETHRENIKRKLGVDNAAALTRFAVAWVENPS